MREHIDREQHVINHSSAVLNQDPDMAYCVLMAGAARLTRLSTDNLMLLHYSSASMRTWVGFDVVLCSGNNSNQKQYFLHDSDTVSQEQAISSEVKPLSTWTQMKWGEYLNSVNCSLISLHKHVILLIVREVRKSEHSIMCRRKEFTGFTRIKEQEHLQKFFFHNQVNNLSLI